MHSYIFQKIAGAVQQGNTTAILRMYPTNIYWCRKQIGSVEAMQVVPHEVWWKFFGDDFTTAANFLDCTPLDCKLFNGA